MLVVSKAETHSETCFKFNVSINKYTDLKNFLLDYFIQANSANAW